MKQDFEALVERLNAGTPIPQVEPEDIRAALPYLAEVREILERAARPGLIAAPAVPTVGFSLDDLALGCRPDADVFPVALQSALASVILPLAQTTPERFGPDGDGFTIQALATMPLLAAELKDTEVTLVRLDGMRSRTRPATEN